MPHVSKDANVSGEEIDNAIEEAILAAESAKEMTSPGTVSQSITQLKTALLDFLGAVKVTSVSQPFDLTYLLVNADIDTDCTGWSVNASVKFSCAEFFERSADFNQTTELKMPKGTYKLMAQGFQRPKAFDATYTDWKAGNSNVVGILYIKNKQTLLKNIYDDAQAKKIFSDDKTPATKVNIPNSMEGASKYFSMGLYENEAMVTTTAAATMKVGINSKTNASGSWTIFDNFRLYYMGDGKEDAIHTISSEHGQPLIYNLQGMPVNDSNLRPGIYVKGGKKIIKTN